MRLSVVTTLFNSAPYIAEFCARSRAAAERVTPEFEIILVNDGSPDDSLATAVRLVDSEPRLKVVDLSRNFGHHKAIMTGLGHARGERVFLLDSDLEEPPELLLEFDRTMAETGADVVYGVQEHRGDPWWRAATARLFYRVFNWLSAEDVHPNQICARLMTRRYVRALLEHRDREIFLAGLWAATGFAQVGVPAVKVHKGKTTYTLRRKLALAINSVTSFSVQPLLLIFYLGSLISLPTHVAGHQQQVRRLVWGGLLAGWASILVTLFFLGGLIVFSIGVVGIYLAKVFNETKDRPYTVVRSVHHHPDFPTDGPE